MLAFPQSQGELIRQARGSRSQAEFSRILKCDRSCLSRYESDSLGAPPHVISACLRIVAALQMTSTDAVLPFARALQHLQDAVRELQQLQSATQQSARTGL